MRRFSGLLGWVAVTAAAFGISMAAVTLVGSSIGDPVASPLSADQVRRQLEQTGGTSPEPSGSPSASKTTAAGQRKLLSSGGGTVIARCAGGVVSLESWSPANGFRTNHVDS